MNKHGRGPLAYIPNIKVLDQVIGRDCLHDHLYQIILKSYKIWKCFILVAMATRFLYQVDILTTLKVDRSNL